MGRFHQFRVGLGIIGYRQFRVLRQGRPLSRAEIAWHRNPQALADTATSLSESELAGLQGPPGRASAPGPTALPV